VQDISVIKINPSAPYLVLAGDIGIPQLPTYEQLLTRESQRFHTVFVVAGNHEFYNGEYTAVKFSIAAICKKFPNVVFLDKTSYWLQESKVRVLGTTLWSHVPAQNAPDVQNGLNDYRLIKYSSRALTVQDTVQFFNDEVAWLKREIQTARQKNEKVLIVTHHAPLKKGTSDPRYETSTIECAFTSDLSSMLGDPVKAWIYGHTVRAATIRSPNHSKRHH
jgi:predicted phosphohydrolase